MGLPIDGGPTALITDSGAPAATPAAPREAAYVRPPGGSASPPARPPQVTVRRKKLRRVLLAVVVIVLAAGGGTLWWVTTDHAVPGRSSPTGEPPDSGRWVPTIVEPCAAVEIDRTRSGDNGDERCQRTPGRDSPQSWVEEPAGGFPKSNAGGPFPGEACAITGDWDYSPVGDHVECRDEAWQVVP